MRAIAISELMEQIDPIRAALLRDCGTVLSFGQLASGKLSLQRANFCRLRICPMCAWRRALKLGGQMDELMRVVVDRGHTYLCHVVLTVRNCAASELSVAIKTINEGYRYMMRKIPTVSDAVIGYYRALEVTYNEDEDSYHPHVHSIWVMRDDYMDGHYIPQDLLSTLWGRAIKADYSPIVHISKIDPGADNISAAVAELTKYTVKDSDILDIADEHKRIQVLATIDDVLHGLRLISYGGILRKIRRELAQADLDKVDLTDDITGDEDIVARYVAIWRNGVYIRYRGDYDGIHQA